GGHKRRNRVSWAQRVPSDYKIREACNSANVWYSEIYLRTSMLRAITLAGIWFFITGFVCAQSLSVPKIPTLGVYMQFDALPGVASVAVMKREVDVLLRPTGIHVNWRLTRENRGDEVYSRLVV